MIESKCFKINFSPCSLWFAKDILGLEESMMVILYTEQDSCKAVKYPPYTTSCEEEPTS